MNAVIAAHLLLQVSIGPWTPAPPLPRPVANNAVVALEDSAGWAIYSMLGIDSTKRWDGIVSWVFRWRIGDRRWEELSPVPGPGRLAATAEAVDGRVLVFGGYTVSADGTERSVPNVDVFDPSVGTWTSAAPFPVPVDDAASGVWRDSLVYVISGWHDTDNVADVQIYDLARDEWRAATPIPGPPVFGHAGSIADNTIVYMGGTATHPTPPRFRIEPSAWRGDIDPTDPTSITWTRLPRYPGPARYRAAAAPWRGIVWIAGGTDNPYNYNGVGYDGVPARPLGSVIGYDAVAHRWITAEPLATATMDHRALAVTGDAFILVGGMEIGQRVSDRVQRAPVTKRDD